MKKLTFIIFIYIVTLLGAVQVFGQASVSNISNSNTGMFEWAYHNILLLIAIIVFLGVALASIDLIWALIYAQNKEEIEKAQSLKSNNEVAIESFWSTLSKKSWNLVPIEKEADIDLGHNYDGIRELDNSLPPWWLYMFYGCIIWAFAYIYYYHFSNAGQNQKQEYIAAMELAEVNKNKYLASQANAIDEKTVIMLADQALLSEGKEMYLTNCAVCHGQLGEGGVGPNFTDKYWLHGGSINEVFSTIKYGVPEKGMIAWKTQLRPAAIQKLASYILSLQGTNPPNQKEPQGQIPEDEVASTPNSN